MLDHFHSFANLLFISLIALFPVLNPIGSALIINPYLANLNENQRKNAVNKIAIYSFSLCIVCLFAGHYILQLFGITVPVIRIAGGLVICKMGWDTLSKEKQNPDKTITNDDKVESTDINNELFYPLTFPITAGAGTISVLFTLSAHSADSNWENYLINTSAIVLAIIVMTIMIHFFYSKTKVMVDKLGNNGQNIANRIFAFLIFCVGLEIALAGIKTIFHL